MLQQINKKIFIYLFLFIFLGTVNNLTLSKIELPKINEIKIYGINQKEKENIFKKLNFLRFYNLFSLNENIIKQKIFLNKYVQEITVFKNYPDTLEIRIKKAEILAITSIDGIKYYIASNGNLIKQYQNDYKNLPYIFGEIDVQEFLNFKEIIDTSDFKFQDIKKLYFYPSRRWDIETSKGVLIKLSNFNIKESLNQFSKLFNDMNFQNLTYFDFRQNNQMIINGR